MTPEPAERVKVTDRAERTTMSNISFLPGLVINLRVPYGALIGHHCEPVIKAITGEDWEMGLRGVPHPFWWLRRRRSRSA